MEHPSYAEIVPRMGLRPDGVPALLDAEAYSLGRIARARSLLGGLRDANHPGLSAFALGSLGRLEASPTSDLDLAFVYDSRVVPRSLADVCRARAVEQLASEYDVPQKTFREAIDLAALIRHVGGHGDSNQTLTHRALLLTEGVWLQNPVAADGARQAIFSVYSRGRVSRGRFLNSLANDLHRYYRTLCVDYRFKVEEGSKAWAVRVLKLRHSRKLWHLANIAMQCWAVDALEDDERDDRIAAVLAWPPLMRIDLALAHFGARERGAGLVRAQDRFLASLASEVVRDELDRLEYGERDESALYGALRYNAESLDEAASEVVDVLVDRCRAHLYRFCLL